MKKISISLTLGLTILGTGLITSTTFLTTSCNKGKEMVVSKYEDLMPYLLKHQQSIGKETDDFSSDPGTGEQALNFAKTYINQQALTNALVYTMFGMFSESGDYYNDQKIASFSVKDNLVSVSVITNEDSFEQSMIIKNNYDGTFDIWAERNGTSQHFGNCVPSYIADTPSVNSGYRAINLILSDNWIFLRPEDFNAKFFLNN